MARPTKDERDVARFDRYLLRQSLTLFGFFALVLVLVYWINRAVVLFDQLIADGQSAAVFLELSLLSLPNIIRIVLPLSAFVASLYVTNRLTADSELVVVQATGFSPFRLARPFLVFGVIVCLLTGALTHFLVPASHARTAAREHEIAQNATARLLQEGQFLTPIAGVTLYIREVTPAGELRDLFITDARSAVETVTYTAGSAYLVRADGAPHLVMLSGMVQTLRHADRRLVTTSFNDLSYDISAMMPQEPNARRAPRELPTWELLRASPELQAETGRSAGRLVSEGHDRNAQALLGVVGALIGFSALMVGNFSRFGLWKQMAGSVLLVILVKLLEAAVVPPVRADAAMWPLLYLPSAFGGLAALSLLTIAARPALFQRKIAP